MAKIVFFSIPAYGHTNPTIEVVRELVKKENEVYYFSFDMFKENIEDAGATFISCDKYLPPFTKDVEKRVGKDFSALIEMVTDVTIGMEKDAFKVLCDIKLDVIVSDSVCFWGKLYASKLNIPFVSSTTTICYNEKTAKLMKKGFSEILYMIFGMKKINACMERLKEAGYDVKNFVDIISNNNDTNTICYTSRMFQPFSESFSDKYHFVGPSIKHLSDNNEVNEKVNERKIIYVSLGTILNKNDNFYEKCIRVMSRMNVSLIMSVGDGTDIDKIKENVLKKDKSINFDNIEIYHKVDQIKVLSKADLFISHSGMNSVQESLYFGVPLILYPKHSEEYSIAERTRTLGAGIIPKSNSEINLKNAIEEILSNDSYKKNALKISKSLIEAGMQEEAARVILKIAEDDNDN